MCEKETGFFLVVWLQLTNMSFTLPLTNESSTLYRRTEDDVINEVNNMLLSERDHFYGSTLRQFSPLDRDSVAAEILLRTPANSTNLMMKVIEQKLTTHGGIFDKNYKKFENRADPYCKPPNISTPLSTEITKPTTIKRSEDFTFTINVDIDCRVSGHVQVSYDIKMYSIDMNAGSFRQVGPLKIGTTVGDMDHTIRTQSLSYGYYYYKVTGIIERRAGTAANSFAFIRVRVTSTPLIVNITGNRRASQGYNRMLTLNGSQSYDPDVGKGDYTGINFTWLCRRAEEKFPNDTTSLPELLPPPETPDAQHRGGCYGSGVGKLKSRAGVPYILDLDIDKMKGDQEYVIKLVMKKRGQTASAVHRLRIEEEIQLSITCQQNCQRQVIRTFRLILKTRCTGLMCDKIDKYTWSMEYREKGKQTWQEIQNIEEILLTQRNSPCLITAPDKLQGNTSYLVTLKGETSDGHSSIAKYEFFTNSPPVGGTCDVDRREGEALKTIFSFTCNGWLDVDKPLTYKFQYNTSDGIEMVFQSGNSSTVAVMLPVGDSNEGYKLQVQILITDALGSSVDTWIDVKVTDPVVNVLESLKDSVDGAMTQYLKENNIGLAAQRATAVLSVVNNAQQVDIKLQDRIKLKDAIVDAWSAVNVSNLKEVSQVSAVVASAANKRNELSIGSQEKAVTILDSMTAFMTQSVKNNSRQNDTKLVEQVGTALLNGLGNLLDITAYEAKEDINDEDAPLIVISNERREKSISYSRQILGFINRVGANVGSTKEPYEQPSVLKTKSLSMATDVQVSSEIEARPLEDQGSKVALPSTKELIGSNGTNQNVLSRQLVTFQFNPYTWDKGASDIKSSVLDFELKDENGNKLSISNLQRDVELFIPPLLKPEPEVLPHYFAKPNDNGKMQFHKIVIPGLEYATSIRIVPSANKNLTLYVRYAQRPTLEDYNFTASVPDYSSCSYTRETRYTNCSADPFTVTLSAAVTGHTGLHFIGIANEVLQNQTRTNTTTAGHQKRVRRGCSSNGRQKRSCVGVKDPPTTPPPIEIIKPTFNASTDVNYTLEVNMATCQFWNVTTEAWSTQGCRAGPKSTSAALQCLCNHLSSFGGNFLVAPNPIDFDYVFKQFPNIFESGNIVVLATVLSIFGVWIIGLLICRRADRKDEYKAVENLRLQVEGEHLFEVSVYTGMWRDCGTSANVAMIVYGEETRSETLHLFDRYSDKRLFARASINNFIVSLPGNLHSPIMIKIWHDNSGNNPSWYVNQVVIKDLETEDKWYFLCNRWLAVDKENGELEADIPLASKNDLSSFKYQFSTRVSKSLGDGHIWLSVVTRPPHSPFTRAQRLSCCVSVLLCAMLAGAMFYQFGEKQEDTIKFGPLRFSLKQLAIGAQSAVVVVPLNLLIVTIFRNIKLPYNDQKQRRYKPDEESGNNAANLNKNKKIKTPGCLPHFFVYIGWALCILSSLTAGTFIVFYSVQWGKEIANQWLTSALVSFFQDIVIMQPIKVVAIALLLALILKKPPEEKTAQSLKDSTLNSNKNAKVVAPKGEELVAARKTRESIVETISTLAEIVLFLVFVVCLFVVVYGNRGYSRYRLTASLENVLKDSFEEEVDSKEAFWEWIEEEFIPGVYDTTWYNDQEFIAPEGYISTKEAFLVGMPRFKQIRVKEEYPCQVAEVYPQIYPLFQRCIPPYSPQDEDDTRFNLPGWIPVKNMSKYDSIYELLRLCPKPWRYNTSTELNTLSYHGRHSMYDGGGFVADLGYNSRTALRVVRNLQSNDWIDQRTAAVLVEFTVFEPSTSLFSVARFLYEVLPTGRSETLARFDTLSIYGTSNSRLRSVFVACQIILLLLIAYFLLLEGVKIYRQSCSYFGSFWNWTNLLQLISTITTIVFFFVKETYVTSFVKEVQANPFETASVDYVLLWSDLELILLSVVIFVVTVKFLRIIRFNRHVCQMVASLKFSSPHMASYSVLFFINILSFALLGLLLFGNDLESYHSFIASLSTLFQKFLGGDLYFYELQSSNRVLGPIYMFSYMFSMAFILINMFLAILNESYDSVKELSGGRFADAELGDFIKEYYLARLTRLHETLKRKLGNFGYRHKLYDRPTNESKLIRRQEFVGSFMSLPSDYPPYVDTWDHVDYSSQLVLIDNEANADGAVPTGDSTGTAHTNEGGSFDEPDITSDPSIVSSQDTNGELLDLLGDLPETTIAPSIASNTNVSNADFMNLLRELPESIVDDDDTIDNVRKGLANIGAVIRLNNNTLRRFSTTGDKFIVQTNLQMGPSVALTLRARRESEPHLTTE